MSAAVLSVPTSPPPSRPLPKEPLPAGHPRAWYIAHNRRLKTMRLVIALLDSGVYEPAQAGDGRIRATASRIGVHEPSDTTCRMVRTLLVYGR
jgi:hypothetical protein